MKVVPLTFLDWNTALWRSQLDAAAEDYLDRSGEEISLREQWMLLGAAMLQQNGLAAWAALNDAGDDLLGYAVCQVKPGTEVTGNTCTIWQVYVTPGKALLSDLFGLGWPLIQKWAEQFGVKRYTITTRRGGRAYLHVLKQYGFTGYAVMYQHTKGEAVS